MKLMIVNSPIVTSLFLLLSASFAEAQDSELADKADAILQQRCYRCHGGSAGKIADLDVSDSQNLLKNRQESLGIDAFMVVPGKLEESMLWDAISGQDSYMPKSGSPEAAAMTAADRAVIKEWIEKGAPFPERRKIAPVSEEMVMQAIHNTLQAVDPDLRKHLRFFTLHHLHNNPKLLDRDLNLHRAALAKVINSLIWQKRIFVMPKALPGTENTVFAINISELDWDRDGHWEAILRQYPYGVHYQSARDDRLSKLSHDIAQLAGTVLPYVRADWFIVHAAQPPLYTRLMKLPGTLKELETRLGVDFEYNFQTGKLARSGFTRSGVSQQNRLVERHISRDGAYWISYDFKPRKSRADLVRFPLGPDFPKNQYRKFAFDHDGGEAIFHLPNGLQGYMLLKGNGDRLDEPGPIDVVFDSSSPLGNPGIINGISCMICHKKGVIRQFNDEIRNADALSGPAGKKIRDLHPTNQEMQKLLDQDEARFMTALQSVTGPFLQVGKDKNTPIDGFPEPVGKVAEQYYKDMTPVEVAAELGLSAETLVTTIRINQVLLRYGLGTLAQKPAGTMKRDKWETRSLTSLYHDIAVELQPGATPVIFLNRRE